MDSFLKNRLKAKAAQPSLLDNIVESPFERTRAKFNNDNKISNNHQLYHLHNESFADKNSHPFSRFDYVNKNPEYFTRKLADSVRKSISIKTIARLELQIKTVTIRWILKFIELDGVRLLLRLLKECISIDSDSSEMEYRILSCFKAMSNNYICIRESLSTSSFIDQVTVCICSSSPSCRKLVCEILISMCYYKYPKCQKLVIDALEKLAIQENTCSKNPFEAWIKCWGRTVRLKSLNPVDECEYSSLNFMLVNAIINACDNQNTRIELRKQMEDSGLEKIFETAVRNGEIYKQIEEFFIHWNRDQVTNNSSINSCYTLVEISPTSVTSVSSIPTSVNSGPVSVNSISTAVSSSRVFKNLLDPQNILDMLWENLHDTHCYHHFLSCLQNMLMFISTHDDLNTKIKYMKSIDQYSFVRCNTSLTYEDAINIVKNQKHQLSNAYKDIEKYKTLYENALLDHIDEEKLSDQIKKNKSLEGLLCMSRNTITTLQQKLKDIQEEYEDNITTLEKQLTDNTNDDAIINKNHSLNSFTARNNTSFFGADNDLGEPNQQKPNLIKEFIETNENVCTEVNENDLDDVTSVKSLRRRTTTDITEEFKSKLAKQFSETNLSTLFDKKELCSNNGKRRFSKVYRRHSIMFKNKTGDYTEDFKVEKKRNLLSLIPGDLNADRYNSVLSNGPKFSALGLLIPEEIPVSMAKDAYTDSERISIPYVSGNILVQEEQQSTLLERDLIKEDLEHNFHSEAKNQCNNIHSCSNSNIPLEITSDSPTRSNRGHISSFQHTYHLVCEDSAILSVPSSVSIDHTENSSNVVTNTKSRNSRDKDVRNVSLIPDIPVEPMSITTGDTVNKITVNNERISTLPTIIDALPPPPPPLPPLPPSSRSSIDCIKRNNNSNIIICEQQTNVSDPNINDKNVEYYSGVKTRILQWQKLHKSNIESTIWSENDQNSTSLVGNLKTSDNLKLTMSESGIFKKMEETFGQQDKEKKLNRENVTIVSAKKKEMHIIDAKRSDNISISVLSKLKHVTLEEVKRSIFDIDIRILDEVLLENLLNNLPTQQEKKQLLFFKQEQTDSVLSKPDFFCLELICIPKYEERLQCMLLILNFQDRISHMSDNMYAIMNASTTLKNSTAVKEFLNLVLVIGNFLNGSNYQGGAYGIRISSINKLIDTKSSRNDTTLLHFIIEMLESQFPDIFNLLLHDLKCCISACKVTLQDLINDYRDLKYDIDKLSVILQQCEGEQKCEVFHRKLVCFHKEAINQFDQLEVKYTSMDVAYKDVLLYFGEDPLDIKLEEFFGIFVKFMFDWETSYKDLIVRREKTERMNKAHRLEQERKVLKKNYVVKPV